MSDELKKLANQAIDLQKKIKSDSLKLQEIKKKIIQLSSNRNNSFIINMPNGKVRVIKSKKLKSILLDKNKFADLDLQTKKKLVRSKVIKLSYLINSKVYEKLLDEGLVDEKLKDLISEKIRQPFYVYIYLNKREALEIKEDKGITELMDVSEDEEVDEHELEDEIDEILKDQDLARSIFSDEDPADMDELEKQEKGFD